MCACEVRFLVLPRLWLCTPMFAYQDGYIWGLVQGEKKRKEIIKSQRWNSDECYALNWIMYVGSHTNFKWRIRSSETSVQRRPGKN